MNKKKMTMIISAAVTVLATGGTAFAASKVAEDNAIGKDAALNFSPTDGIRRQLADMQRSMAAASPLLILISVLLGYGAAGAMLRPIEKIEKTAAEIAKGSDLGKRINLGEGKDELHRLAGTFDDMFEKLEDSFEMERRFTSNASHELRTPMSVIMAQTEDALSQELTADEYKDALHLIDRQGRRMNALISDMLDYSRMDNAPERYPFDKIDLSETTGLVCYDMSVLKEHNIDLTSTIEDGIMINGNSQLISRLIQNLISNAYRYGKENGHIHASVSRHGKMAVIRIEDDGIGISEDDLPRIFERFYRGDNTGRIKGTGLGLSIVKKITELHGGNISAESTSGKGTVFTINIPIAD